MAGRDSHVRPIRQKNGGLSAARTLNGSCENFVPGRLSRVNAQKSKNIFYEARMRAISSRKSCSEHR